MFLTNWWQHSFGYCALAVVKNLSLKFCMTYEDAHAAKASYTNNHKSWKIMKIFIVPELLEDFKKY
jgi:hypothetical protein